MEFNSTSEVEEAVRERYGAAAQAQEAALCCPVDYDTTMLKVIPEEVIERDYGCGDPSRYVREGDTVLDLGSGGGKICFIAAQIVGEGGRVIGVDTTPDMLDLARRSAPVVAEAIGYDVTAFHRGQIQDLALDWDKLGAWLSANPITTPDDLIALEAEKDRLRREEPMIPDNSVDVIVSNCVLNLVADSAKGQLIEEIFRVLKPGGRIAISDIVSDEFVPEHLMADPHLWSGCISGSFQERDLMERMERVGLRGLAIDKWEETPFAVVEGIEFRSVTITGFKGEEGARVEGNQAVIYRGPFSEVKDDEGNTLRRGERAAVCTSTFRALSSETYAGQFVLLSPEGLGEDSELPAWDDSRDAVRHPREVKGKRYRNIQMLPGSDCTPGGGCC